MEESLPPRGAWIEIAVDSLYLPCSSSLPPRGAWIEITAAQLGIQQEAQSLPPRGA